MARGVPVIASRGGGVDEILAAPAPALTVPPGDPDALAAAIVRTVADPEAALARASQAWTTVRDSYGIGSTADGVAAVWSGVAGLARVVRGTQARVARHGSSSSTYPTTSSCPRS